MLRIKVREKKVVVSILPFENDTLFLSDVYRRSKIVVVSRLKVNFFKSYNIVGIGVYRNLMNRFVTVLNCM